MSWEWDEKEVACPCGNGTILVRSGSDDWGRSDHEEEMRCPTCRRRYVYIAIAGDTVRQKYGPSGKWVTREEDERRRAAAVETERQRAEETLRARERYGKALVDALAHVRSRRAVWSILRDAGVGNYLTGFNKTARARGREEAIRDLIEANTVDAVARLIRVLQRQSVGARRGSQK